MKKALILSGGGARGAFQVGVWKYLREINWTPDLICGTSIGAINAAAIGSGMPVKRLIDLWETHNRSEIYRLKTLHF
jgi:NTE family protein